MSEEEALSSQAIRKCILKQITSFQDLLNVSLLNIEWFGDAKKLIEERGILKMSNDGIFKYSDIIKERIISGRYLQLSYLTCEIHNEGTDNFKFTKGERGEVVKRLPLLGPRIRDLVVDMGRSMTVVEMMALLKASKNASSISWHILEFDTEEHQEKLSKFLEKLGTALDSEDLSFEDTKTLKFYGNSEIEWEFWAEEFIQYFPNLENLKVHHYNEEDTFTISEEFLEKIDDMEYLEDILEFSCSTPFSEEISNRFLEKSYSFTKLDLKICDTNIIFLELFLDKYKHQIEELRLDRLVSFEQLKIPAMEKLRKLDLDWRWCKAFQAVDRDQVLIGEDEEAYPKLTELQFGGKYIEILMIGFRNISKNKGVSAKIQKITVKLDMDAAALNKWNESGKEADVLVELDRLFPNSNNNMYKDPEICTDLENYKKERKRRCVIS